MSASNPPTEADLRAESSLLPRGWVVGWSRSQQKRFWARAPTATLPEIKQWTAPTPDQAVGATPVTHSQEQATNNNNNATTDQASSSSSSSSSALPHFEAWKPPSAASKEAEIAAAKLAAEKIAQANAAAKALAADMKEQEDKERDFVEANPKKRRAGLGFDSEEGEERGSHRQKVSTMRFVTAGGAEADTPANTAAAAAALASSTAPAAPAIIYDPIPSNPKRLESASRPRCDVANPPVYATSNQAYTMLAQGLGRVSSTNKEWDDAERYLDLLRSSTVQALNNIYFIKDNPKLIEEYLQAKNSLPLPPERDFSEEPPVLINKRRDVFNGLDHYLTELCLDAKLKAQPSMAFLRWGFNQRSLQNPADNKNFDPLLPMDASVDYCLMTELIRERLTRLQAEEICVKLASKCKEKATELISLKKRLMERASSSQPLIQKFTLLTPKESHMHLLSKQYDASAAAAGPSKQPYRERDLNSFNQDELLQYKVIYDWKGPGEYAIPLNQERFDKLVADYTRTTGPITPSPKEDQVFLRRLWTMIAKYDTISGAGYQAALPEESFGLLQKYWGVTHECYASPLNHCLDSFGSAFIETDHFFGSKGSFLDQRPLEGSFEANPPFLEEVMAANAMHVLALLERAEAVSSPLCFVVIWPGWSDCCAYDLLMTSRFMQHLIVFEKGDHYYKEGLQHRTTKAPYRLSRARSFVFWMQTEAATKQWPCTEEKLRDFKRSFMQRR